MIDLSQRACIETYRLSQSKLPTLAPSLPVKHVEVEYRPSCSLLREMSPQGEGSQLFALAEPRGGKPSHHYLVMNINNNNNEDSSVDPDSEWFGFFSLVTFRCHTDTKATSCDWEHCMPRLLHKWLTPHSDMYLKHTETKHWAPRKSQNQHNY